MHFVLGAKEIDTQISQCKEKIDFYLVIEFIAKKTIGMLEKKLAIL